MLKSSMLIGRPACCYASNCDDVLHHITIYENYCCIISDVKTAMDSCVAVRKVALVMSMMCLTNLNMFMIIIVMFELLSGLGNC